MTNVARGRRAALSGLALAAIVAGCGAVPIPGSSAPLPVDLGASAWAVVELPGLALVDERRPFVRFDGGRLSGSTGCNDLQARVEISGDQIRVEEIVTTDVGCGDPIGRQEAAFLEGLAEAERVRTVGSRLVLAGPGGEMVLEPVAD
jgi:heat shock protein HslJ